MTIRTASQKIIEQVKTIYDETEATNIAVLLLEYIAGFTRTEQTVSQEKKITEAQSEKINLSLFRLLNHEPIQYILNECWFYGMKFFVDQNVLIPRPETEELVDWIIRDLKPCLPAGRFPVTELNILDMGTGSGCIAISLKRKLRKTEVWACDISEEALIIAKKNSESLQADIHFIQLDFLNETERNKLPLFDMIISNPPYILQKDKETMQQNVLDFEPHTALFVADNNPLVFYSAIANFANTHLNKNGNIYCEIHESLGKNVAEIFLQNKFKVEIKKDMQGKERMIKAMKEES